MNAPLNQEEFALAFKDIERMYKLFNYLSERHAVITSRFPLSFDKYALYASKDVNENFMLALYKEDFRNVKTFKTLVNKWMYTS
jgi:ABC-type transporter Mla maintaining outer membrane lipid asymmetry ATPase subunit MlaF